MLAKLHKDEKEQNIKLGPNRCSASTHFIPPGREMKTDGKNSFQCNLVHNISSNSERAIKLNKKIFNRECKRRLKWTGN